MNAITTYRPGRLGHKVIYEVFDSFFSDFPNHLKASTQGYPVADIYHDENGSTILEFALAGFKREELEVNVEPDKKSITVSASTLSDNEESNRRIARRNFKKTYVNYDNNLDLSGASASFENGLLTVTVPRRPDLDPLVIKIN